MFSLQKSLCVSLSNNQSNKSGVSWTCLANLSCINVVVDQVRAGRSVNIGYLTIKKQQAEDESRQVANNGFFSFLKSRSLKMSLGPLVLDISASKEHKNYLEVALLGNDASGIVGRCKTS